VTEALTEVADTGDRVVLTAPRGNLALSAMRVVTGWMASCHDLPLDQLDDVQLAIETVLAEEPDTGCDLSLSVSAEAGVLHAVLEGLESPGLKAALLSSEGFEPSPGCLLDVRLFLDALLDHYHVLGPERRPFGVHMQKRIV
jgi:hypothetical protein